VTAAPATPADKRARDVAAAVTRFRVLAVIVGIGLLVLVLVAMPLRYLAGYATFSEHFSPVHGAAYMGYLVVTVDLGRRVGWSLGRMVGVMLAGTVPLLSFVVERRVTRELSADPARRPAPA
jgi:integral membrane protein